jgi:hypothetical protein
LATAAAQGRVISGHVEALEAAEKLALQRGALKATRLAVSGAFHTRLMEPARRALEEVLGQVGGGGLVAQQWWLLVAGGGQWLMVAGGGWWRAVAGGG